MKFKSEFRSLSNESKPEFKIRDANGMPLVLIKENGEAKYANARMSKDALIDQFNEETDLLLWAWVGRWSTDIFQLTKEDLKKYYM